MEAGDNPERKPTIVNGREYVTGKTYMLTLYELLKLWEWASDSDAPEESKITDKKMDLLMKCDLDQKFAIRFVD